jgi:hypothetical protein
VNINAKMVNFIVAT